MDCDCLGLFTNAMFLILSRYWSYKH